MAGAIEEILAFMTMMITYQGETGTTCLKGARQSLAAGCPIW